VAIAKLTGEQKETCYPLDMQRLIVGISGIVLGALLCASCTNSLSRLDEEVFYKGPAFSLKLVRYYESLPLHYTGEIFVVSCSSPATATSPAHQTQDHGWVQVGRGGAIGPKTAHDMVLRERSRYLVVTNMVLVVPGTVLRVSFDACGSFAQWDPLTLPGDLIVPSEKPDFCKPKGLGDCRYHDFQGDRVPQYDEITSEAMGMLTFTVQAKAFKDGQRLKVVTSDFGRTWSIQPL
jgi:hypothetical protein